MFTKVKKCSTKIIFQCKCVFISLHSLLFLTISKGKYMRLFNFFLGGGGWTLLHCWILRKFGAT